MTIHEFPQPPKAPPGGPTGRDPQDTDPSGGAAGLGCIAVVVGLVAGWIGYVVRGAMASC